jgi:hypothetical protein
MYLQNFDILLECNLVMYSLRLRISKIRGLKIICLKTKTKLKVLIQKQSLEVFHF